MKITCLMPTYNKCPQSQWLLEEAVESFLRQDYPDKELLIYNDCEAQEIVCDKPEVVVVNHPHRHASLGEKLNAMAQLADGELLARWDDDDISLPWRLSDQAARMISAKLDYCAPRTFWATNKEKTELVHGAYATCMVTRKAALELPYLPISFGEDRSFELELMDSGYLVDRYHLPVDRVWYLYRWNTGSAHLSGYGEDGDGWAHIGGKAATPGTFHLSPYWREDYVARIRAVHKVLGR